MLKLGIVKLISSKFRIRLLAWHHNAVCNVGIIVSIHAWSITDLILFVLSTYYSLCKVCTVYFTAYQEGEDTIFACHHYLTLNGWIRAVVRIVSQVVMYGFELANCDAYFFNSFCSYLIASWLYIHVKFFLWELYLFVENFIGLASFVNCLVATIHGICWLQYMLIHRYLWNPIDSHCSIVGTSIKAGFCFNLLDYLIRCDNWMWITLLSVWYIVI